MEGRRGELPGRRAFRLGALSAFEKEGLMINWKLLAPVIVVIVLIALIAGFTWLHFAGLLGELN